MTKEELTEIVKLADKTAIDSEMEKRGYIYCNEHKKLGKVGIVSLVHSVICETEDYTDDERKHLYSGCICGSVTGYENYEFIFVEVYDIKISTDPFDDEETAIQTGMLIWAKELK